MQIIVRPMHVQIALDGPQTTWTNLDILRGKVLLRVFGPTPITSIVVKLEGESRTRLKATPRSPLDNLNGNHGDAVERPVIREEVHKFPFNNSCQDATPSAASNLAKIARTGLSSRPPPATPVRHVKRTLPPTLTTFPGVAEIRYYLKVTVKRKEFYKENPRVIQNLTFFPIEPPRRAATGAEIYARRRYEFAPLEAKAANRIVNAFKRSDKAAKHESGSDEPPIVSVDVRIPNPPIVTCNEDLPLRIVVKRLNGSKEPLFLQSIHISLHGTTRTTANEILQEAGSDWVILSRSNMGFPLRLEKTNGNIQEEEVILDPTLWRGHPLPNSVCPSFQTCNIARMYVLEVSVGIGYRYSHTKNTNVLLLRHPVDVYSGIAPPAALLAAIANQRKAPTQQHVEPPRATMPTRRPVPQKSSATTAPPDLRTDASIIPPTAQAGPSTPISTPGASGPNSVEAHFAPLPPGEEEPPPSYEDAIADSVPSVDAASRREYRPPEVGDGGFGGQHRRTES